jgi:hypothetical protein
MTPPAAGSAHVIGDALAFLAVYPHPIPLLTGHVNCGDANFASWTTWEGKILSGAMRARAEEIHYLRSLGALSAIEQPPTAHEHIIGCASFETAAELHGDKHTKTYLWFARGLRKVQPSAIVPDRERINFKASVSGTPEEKMLQRSYISRSVADAHTATWLPQLAEVPTDYARPAAEPCAEYESGQAALHHNFAVFRARYAPRLSIAALHAERNWRAVIVIPMHAADGTWALCPTGFMYGWRHDPSMSLEMQTKQLGVHLQGGVPPTLACIAANTMRDYVVLLSHTIRPMSGATNPTDLAHMRSDGHEHVWCRPGALDGDAYMYVGLALRRIESARRAMAPADGVQIGMWECPRPVIRSVVAHEWNAANASSSALDEWEAFLREDLSTVADFKSKLCAADSGDGALVAIANVAVSAADYADELCPPEQGAPSFDADWLRQHPYPARTPSVSAHWLAEIPPQQLPPGCPTAVSWTSVCRPWARRLICQALDASADHGVDLWRHGYSDKQRHPFLCLGRGAVYDVPHIDGIGTWNFMDVLWRRRDSDSYLEPLDISKRVTDHKDIEFLFELFSPPGGPRCTDQELLSMLSRQGGAVLKIGGEAGPPRQIRIGKNLTSLDSRIRQVAAPTLKVIKAGLYRCVAIREADARLNPDGPCPLLHVPTFVNSTGGADKGPVVPGGPPSAEARRVGDDSAPHTIERERNSPHGDPDGPIVQSKNELTGPKKAPPGYYEPGYTGPTVPWPNKECKQGARDFYGGCAVLRSLAAIDGKKLVSHASDVKWMFWQFYLRGDQYWMCTFLLVMEVDGSLQVFLVEERVLNMGLRPASKIASRFSEEWVEAWRRELRIWVRREWLPRQSAGLRTALKWREVHLGVEHADPFWAAPYTDDYVHVYLDSEVGVAGVQLEIELSARARLWMSPKYAVGTVPDWTGGRAVLNGGFGTLRPEKRTRAITDCTAALNGSLNRAHYESHASFLVHADLWLNFPEGTLRGSSGPLKIPGFDTDIVTLTSNAASAQEAALYELQTRPCASFLCSIRDAEVSETLASRQRVEFASDSCSDVPAPRRPHICWAAHGTMGRFLLEGPWLEVHITLTEGCGPALAILELAPSYPLDTIVLATDATAAAAAMLDKAQVLALQIMMRRLKGEQAYREAVVRLFVAHCAGFANILTDAGSRDMMDVVHAVAAAYDLRMRFPATSVVGMLFMADVISWVALPSPDHPLVTTKGQFLIVNADAPSYTAQPGDIRMDRSHPSLGNFLAMADESQRPTVCHGFDDVWHGRATVDEAATKAGIRPSGRTASATLEQRHAAAADIAARVVAGEQIRGVCHCAPRRCHLHTVAKHVMALVCEARTPAPIRRRLVPRTGGTLFILMLGLCVSTPAADVVLAPTYVAVGEHSHTGTNTALASGQRTWAAPTGCHPIFSSLLLGMPPLADLSRSPSPLAHRQRAPYVATVAAASAVALAAVVVAWGNSPPRKRRALAEASPELEAPRQGHTAGPPPFCAVSMGPDDLPAAAVRTPTSRQPPLLAPSPDMVSTRVPHTKSASSHSLGDVPNAPTSTRGWPQARRSLARWSPQPRTAAAARASAAGDLAATLANDTSKYALLQGRPQALADLCEEAAALRDEGAKKGTSKRDTWGYNKVAQVCESAELNSPIMRPRVHEIDAAGKAREAFWAALLVMKLIMVIAPCARNAAKGITQGKPASALQAVYGYYAVMRDCGRFVPDFKLASQHLRGLNERFKVLFGLGALIQRQVQPFSHVMLLAMITLLTSGGGIPGWSATFAAAWAVILPFLVMTGTRKDEWTKDGTDDNDYLRRSNFQWMDGEHEVMHTTENLRALPKDAFLRGQAGPSKCDRYLQTWGTRLQWFRRDDTNPLNFASAFLRWELAYPCPMDQRSTWAAFSPTGTAAPFSSSSADKAHSTLMTSALGAAAAALRSLHAYRVTLASALRGIPRTPSETTEDNDGIIQMCLRWSSVESVRTYSRVNRFDFARYTDLGSKTCAFKASNLEPLPPTDASDVATEIDETISEMAKERTTSKASTDGPVPMATPRRPETLPLANTTPLTRNNATGRRVLIPAATWPHEVCKEHNGVGWEATIQRCSVLGATVTFSAARTATGRQYNNVLLELSALEPL